MTTYASTTSVTSEKSRGEIERTLTRYGANSFMYGWDNGRAVIMFEMSNRRIRFVLQMPDRNDFALTPSKKKKRTPSAIETAYEQAVRQKWRALALVIKAKLEAVESGISIFEDEFLAQTVLPSGETVSSYISPQIKTAYKTGKMPALLPMIEEVSSKTEIIDAEEVR